MAHQLILEEELASVFTGKDLIQLPDAYRLALVRYGPLVVSVLFPAALLATVLNTENLSVLGTLTLHLKEGLSLLFLLASLATGVAALPGLYRQTRCSWSRLYWAGLLHAVSAISTLDVGALLLTFALGFYPLFQIRSYYNQ